MRRLSTSEAALLLAATAALTLLPLLVVAVPPLLDYPNHLARCYVLAELGERPALRALYEPRLELLPNLAMDAIVVPLTLVMPVELAGRIFCGVVLVALLAGALALSRALFGAPTVWSVAPALLLFNRIYAFGFLNFLFGIGLMLWGLAVWVRLRERPVRRRLVMAALFAVGLFLSHLLAMVLFLLALTGFELADWWSQRPRTARALVLSLAPVAIASVVPALLLLLTPTRSEAGTWEYVSAAKKLDSLVRILRIDGSTADAAYSAVLLMLAGGLWLSNSVRLDRRVGGALLATGAAFLVLPRTFATSGCVDLRVPIVVLLLLASGTTLSGSGRLAKAALGCLAGLLVLRVAYVTSAWRADQHELARVLSDLAGVEAGSVVFSAADRRAHALDEQGWSPPLTHAPLLALLARPLFIPQIFAVPTQHPLAVRPELLPLQRYQTTDPRFFSRGEVGEALAYFREVVTMPENVPPSLGADPVFYVFVQGDPERPLGPVAGARLVAQRQRYALYRLTGLEGAMAARRRHWQQRSPLP